MCNVNESIITTVKSVKSGKSKGLVIIAGDISPIAVISHLPVLCEDNDIPYIYVPSKVTPLTIIKNKSLSIARLIA